MRRRGFLAAAAAAVLTFETFLGARRLPVIRETRQVVRYLVDGEVFRIRPA